MFYHLYYEAETATVHLRLAPSREHGRPLAYLTWEVWHTVHPHFVIQSLLQRNGITLPYGIPLTILVEQGPLPGATADP